MGLKGFLLRLGVSAAGAVLVVALASLGLFVASWPKFLSMVLQPASLLLAPGVVASLLFTHGHDYVADAVLKGAFAFYTVALFAVLETLRRGERRFK